MKSGSRKKNKPTQVPLELIRADNKVQSRAGLDNDVVEEYKRAMQNGAKFPPVDVFYDGSDLLLLADGFHRFRAAQYAGIPMISAIIHHGSERDAILHSLSANNAHGLRRSNADKRHSVLTLLGDEEWSLWSNVKIAKQCGVDEKTVRNIRGELSSENPKLENQNRTYKTRHGSTATMRTGKIGGVAPGDLAGEPMRPKTLADDQGDVQGDDQNPSTTSATLARVANDFYPTATRLTEILLEQINITGRVLEPCAGDGAIAKLIPGCIANDLYPLPEFACDYELDAALPETWGELAKKEIDWVVTNPPFALAPKIIPLAFEHVQVGLAVLLRLSYLEPCMEKESSRRGQWLESNADHLSNVIVFGDPRPPFRSDATGGDNVTVAWFVWRKDWSWKKLGSQCPFSFARGWKDSSASSSKPPLATPILPHQMPRAKC